MNFLVIKRAERFSPHSVERDAAIMGRVAALLRADGHTVTELSEDDIPNHLPSAAGVLSMARSEQMLGLLSRAEDAGTPVLNSARSVAHCNRVTLATLMARLGVAAPRLWVLTPGGLMPPTPGALWLKRGDACAQQPGDVVPVAGPLQLRAAMEGFASRGVRSVVAAEHLAGDLIKFYGVEQTPFFFTCYPTFSKFGLEAHNGQPCHLPFDAERLQADATRLAQGAGVAVFGGDAIVGHNGLARIIDFNDWPSFAPCREAAATHIVKRFYQSLQTHV